MTTKTNGKIGGAPGGETMTAGETNSGRSTAKPPYMTAIPR